MNECLLLRTMYTSMKTYKWLMIKAKIDLRKNKKKDI